MLEDIIKGFREEIQGTVDRLNTYIAALDQFPALDTEDRGEVAANMKLAMRHLEDARMRLGKVYQARDGKTNSER